VADFRVVDWESSKNRIPTKIRTRNIVKGRRPGFPEKLNRKDKIERGGLEDCRSVGVVVSGGGKCANMGASGPKRGRKGNKVVDQEKKGKEKCGGSQRGDPHLKGATSYKV